MVEKHTAAQVRVKRAGDDTYPPQQVSVPHAAMIVTTQTAARPATKKAAYRPFKNLVTMTARIETANVKSTAKVTHEALESKRISAGGSCAT